MHVLGEPTAAACGDCMAVVGRSLPGSEAQCTLGPQSLRGDPGKRRLARLMGSYIQGDPHAESCFQEFLANERRLCSHWAVFYHSYSFAAVLYEVQAAIAAALFGFPSHCSPLPRLLGRHFAGTRDARALLATVRRLQAEAPGRADHHWQFRKVAISSMCSLMSSGPEVCVAKTFAKGYSSRGLAYGHILENLVRTCGVPEDEVLPLMSAILGLALEYGLDTSKFGGQPCGSGKSGHLLQIFVRWDLVDQLAYAARPYGAVDQARMPLASWLSGDHCLAQGQARLLAHPAHFLRADRVRIFVASADRTYHERRRAFQQELSEVLQGALQPDRRRRLAVEICSTMPLQAEESLREAADTSGSRWKLPTRM